MSVFPSTTVSDALNFFIKVGVEDDNAARPRDPTHAAPNPRTVCAINSRRLIATSENLC
jgi:hypothetical protein